MDVFLATAYLVLTIGRYVTRVVGGTTVGAEVGADVCAEVGAEIGAEVGAAVGAAGVVACDEDGSSDSDADDVEYSVEDSTGLVRRCGSEASLT